MICYTGISTQKIKKPFPGGLEHENDHAKVGVAVAAELDLPSRGYSGRGTHRTNRPVDVVNGNLTRRMLVMVFLAITAVVLLLMALSSLMFGTDPVSVMASAGVAAVVTALLAIAFAIRDLK